MSLSEICAKLCAGAAKVILVVLSATSDFATQEALKIAKDLDSGGDRSIGVITKIDKDPSGLAAKMQEAQRDGFCARLGFVPVWPAHTDISCT